MLALQLNPPENCRRCPLVSVPVREARVIWEEPRVPEVSHWARCLPSFGNRRGTRLRRFHSTRIRPSSFRGRRLPGDALSASLRRLRSLLDQHSPTSYLYQPGFKCFIATRYRSAAPAGLLISMRSMLKFPGERPVSRFRPLLRAASASDGRLPIHRG